MSEPVIELICIGRELLDGRVLDTNSVEMAKMLRTQGLVPRFVTRGDDVPSQIKEIFRVAEERANIVLVTGGLGPTEDDLTLEVFADYAGLKMEVNPEASLMVQKAFANRGLDLESMDEGIKKIQLKQAILPVGAQPLLNMKGTAPGVKMKKGSKEYYFMPGVPAEMKVIFENSVLPNLPSISGYKSYEWWTQFTSEGELQKRLLPIIKEIKGTSLEISFRTKSPENHIGLYGSAGNFDLIKEKISKLLINDCFSQGTFGQVKSLENIVIEQAISNQLRLCTVESCTGGKVADRLVAVPGASKTYWGSFVCYDNLAKESLGVSKELINQQGAVSEAVAIELAKCGLKKVLQSGCSKAACVSVTGIAGPDGGSAEKPVGLCFVGYADTNGEISALRCDARPGLERGTYQNFFTRKALNEFFKRLVKR